MAAPARPPPRSHQFHQSAVHDLGHQPSVTRGAAVPSWGQAGQGGRRAKVARRSLLVAMLWRVLTLCTRRSGIGPRPATAATGSAQLRDQFTAFGGAGPSVGGSSGSRSGEQRGCESGASLPTFLLSALPSNGSGDTPTDPSVASVRTYVPTEGSPLGARGRVLVPKSTSVTSVTQASLSEPSSSLGLWSSS